MPRRIWRSLDGPYVAARPGDTVDLRGTTRASAVAERKELLLQSYYSGVGSYFGGYSTVTTVPGRPWTLDRGVREGYGRVVWVYRAVRVIALAQSRLRFGVKDNDKPVGMGATELTDDPLVPMLNVRANPVEFGYQFRERVSTQWMLSPRGGFIETVQFARRRGTSELRLLPAGRTRIVPDKGGNIDHFEVDPVGGVGKPRPVDPQFVRWFREPHPTDPFAGMTPLEAAGLSIEMDHFARLFNRQSMANDGRPGGIVAVTSPDGKGEPADEAELDRIERKFGGGPMDAGRLVVIDGTVTYTDASRSQRDLQWGTTRSAGRDEIFVAFGVPVSVAGDSSERTFSNGGQEWIDFWTLTGVTHGDAFAWLFHDDVDGVPFLDYSKVRALQVLAEQQRAEWRDEVQQGLRIPLRYAQDTGQPIGDEPGDFPDVPATRSLWFPGSGRVPIAQNEEDQLAVDKLAPLGSGTQGAPLQEGAPGGGDGGGGDAGGGSFGTGGGGDGGQGGGPDGLDALGKQLVPHHAGDSNLASIAVKRAARRREAATAGARARARRDHGDDDQEDHRADAAATALEAHMTALANRLVGVTVARVQGVKARMGTRHWVPKPGEPVSTKQLDGDDVVDPQAWYDQAEQVARDNLGPVVQTQYDTTAGQVGDDGGAELAALLVAGATATALGVGPTLLAAELAAATAWLATSAANHAAELLAVVQRAEADDAARVAAGGQPLGVQPIVDAIREWAKGIPAWIKQVAPTAAAQAVEAGKHAALTPLGDRVERVWRTKRDDKVRAAHKLAEGQVAKAGQPFVVDAEQLRYPRDPNGSPGNVINCRCRTRWRLAARTAGGSAGPDVVAKVLAMPTPSSKFLDEAVADGGTRWRVARGARVVGGGVLAGVEGRDHVAEILGVPAEEKRGERHVRTSEGAAMFHEPIGSPIIAHPGLRGIGGRDHVAEITKPDASAASAAAARAELARRLGDVRARMGGGMPSGSSPFPGANDHTPDHPQAAKLREQAIAYNKDAEGWHTGIEDEIRAAQPQARVLLPDAPAGTGKSSGRNVVVYRGFETSEGWIDAGEPEVRKLPAARVQRTGDAARALRAEGRRTGLPFRAYRGQVTDAKRWGDAEDPAAEMPSGAVAATGDYATAKAELEAKGQSLLQLIDKGMDPAEAEKEYARLLHNARFRARRDRLKAEKAAGGKKLEAVAADVGQGPKQVTLAGIGQQLLDDPESVKLDVALGKEAGVQPKALYSATKFAHGDGTTGWKVGAWRTGATGGSELLDEHEQVGPGAVVGDAKWYDALTADSPPIPVHELHVEGGYVVKHGLAFRRNGVSYLVETDAPADPGDAAATAALTTAADRMESFLATVPEERRSMQRGVALLKGANPKDAHWAQEFGMPGFVSDATGGNGGTTWWGGRQVAPGLAAHEFGHNLDSGVHLPGQWLSDSGPVLEGQAQDWKAARYDDRSTQKAWTTGDLAGQFTETRGDPAHPITLGAESPTAYAAHNPHEDFAESVRLYLKDRREGKLGYLKPEAGQQLGTNVRFADLWPARARVLDVAFGVQSDYETPFVKRQQQRAADAVAVNRMAIHEAVQQQGSVPEDLGLTGMMEHYGLGMHAGGAAWTAGDEKFRGELATKNEADALDHVKELLSGQANAPEAGQAGELESTLVDGFELTPAKAKAVVADGVSWHAEQLEAQKQAQAATDAKLAAEKAVQDVLSLEDLPKEVQTVIRKRRANVKLRAKQKGATAEQAEAIAAQYEAEQIAKEAKKLGLSGQVLGKEIVKGKVAAEVHAQAAGPELRVKPGVKGASKGSATWLAKAGEGPAPKAKDWVFLHGKYGKPQQAKSNIAATLAARLNNESDWELYRAYVNSGASQGRNGMMEYPKTAVQAFADTTEAERQAVLDAEVSMRVSGWASTSGDSNPFAVMMQQAVKDELGVPGPVGVNDKQGTTQAEVDKRYPHVAAFYRRFVREQYEHTQEQLAADGIEWVVLYRGMGVERGSHAWANDTDDGYVPLQPASSFSTAPNVSQRFAGTGSKRMMIRGVVHRSQVLGSARTGFGCLNEKEWVVLAPRDETEGRFQARYFAGSTVAQVKAAFDRPPRPAPTMSLADAQDALRKALPSGTGVSPSRMQTALRAAPAGSATIDYPTLGGGTVALPRDAVLAYLTHLGYDA